MCAAVPRCRVAVTALSVGSPDRLRDFDQHHRDGARLRRRFLAQLPDKTALAGLVLGTRYRASYVFAGVATAFAVHVVLAVAAGSALTLLPQRIVHAITGVLFLAGAAVLLLKKGEGEEEIRDPANQSFWKVSGGLHAHPGRRVR